MKINWNRLVEATKQIIRNDKDVMQVYEMDRCEPVYVYLEVDWDGVETLVFTRILTSEDTDGTTEWSRQEAEKFSAKWLADNLEKIDDFTAIRFDDVFVCIVNEGCGKPGSGKALLRRSVNCLGNGPLVNVR